MESYFCVSPLSALISSPKSSPSLTNPSPLGVSSLNQTLMELQRRTMEIQNMKAQLKAQHATVEMDHSSAEVTLRYLQEQKEEAVVYYAVGRMCVLQALQASQLKFAPIDLLFTRFSELKHTANLLLSPLSFVKHSMKEAREGHADGLKKLSTELTDLDKAIAVLDKQGQDAQSNLIDFLKTNNIPFQVR